MSEEKVMEDVVRQPVNEAVASYYFNGPLLSKRFDVKEIKAAIERARARFPNEVIYYLTDEYDLGSETPSPLQPLTFQSFDEAFKDSDATKVFLCAFESDEKLIVALRKVINLKNAFYFTPLKFYPTSRYFHRNDLARAVLKEEQSIDLPKFEVADYENLIQAIDITRKISGDYVEIGVYQGRSAHMALKYMQASGFRRRSFFLDVFEGFTYDSAIASADAFWVDLCTDTSIETVSEFLAEFDNKEIVKLDIIENELPASITSIAVCNIDVDIYEAVLAALLKTAPLMNNGGIIVIEDQGHTPALAGGYLALCDFLETETANDFIPVHMGSGQMFLIRR